MNDERRKETKKIKEVYITCTATGSQALYSTPFIPIGAQRNSYGYLHFIGTEIDV